MRSPSARRTTSLCHTAAWLWPTQRYIHIYTDAHAHIQALFRRTTYPGSKVIHLNWLFFRLLQGDVPSQTGYHLLTRQKLTVDQQAVCDIDLNIAGTHGKLTANLCFINPCVCCSADAAVAAQTTLTILTPQQQPLPFAGLKLAQRTFSPGVYTVLACTTLQAAAAAPTRWQLSVRSNPAVKLENVAMPGKFPAEGTVQGLPI